MSIRIIVPHRGLAAAKTRLATILHPEERMQLAERLLAGVLLVARQACDDVVVISPSVALEPMVSAAGARLVAQHGMGLNAGLEEARAAALAEGVTTLVVLHGDLPNIGTRDIHGLLDALPSPAGVVIAPDRAGTGTNALAMQPAGAIPFRFGIGSHAAHRAAAEEAGLPFVDLARPGLAFDLDTPEDLARWIELGDAA
ncbi:MAG: 2-phospho-L-lactate guanylyltransferase [Chloroflexota bacterium]|nr:2-phospho-L-lactate guanylyltransferase [Chloroflexota bacterium]